MSTNQTNKDKLCSSKCRHFCFSFDIHNYCPTCRESGKGDEPCVTFEAPCDICASFTDEQVNKFQHRKCYLKKQKKDTTSPKDDKIDLWVRATGILLLVLMQILRVLQTTPTSPTPTLQFIVSKHQQNTSTSQKLSHHPRYCLTA